MILTIKIEVENDLEAYQVLNKIALTKKVTEANYKNKKHSFKSKKVKDFLKNK